MAVLLHPHPVLLDSIAALPDRFKDNFLERKVEQTTTTEAEKVKKKKPTNAVYHIDSEGLSVTQKHLHPH